MEVRSEPRALVMADTLSETLKRALQSKSAQEARPQLDYDLRGLLAQFNCQSVPASLFHYHRFKSFYDSSGAQEKEIMENLVAEADTIELPQVVHTASCAAFYPIAQRWDAVRLCAVGRGFDKAEYAEPNETIWIAAEIESQTEVGRELAAKWCDRLTELARACYFKRVRVWLIAPNGFDPHASELLIERDVYGSNHQQVQLLIVHLKSKITDMTAPASQTQGAGMERPPLEEIEMVIPMSEDTELIAARTAEQIARRINFQPEAINQIKTALIEACINATEHSTSPERKIYQQFRLEKDRLVITVASGSGMGTVSAQEEEDSAASDVAICGGRCEHGEGRCGWGLKLIRSLMDEVEFERIDEGTRLRMTKLLRQ
jgi:serine/threonine-protein kinase RsbW